MCRSKFLEGAVRTQQLELRTSTSDNSPRSYLTTMTQATKFGHVTPEGLRYSGGPLTRHFKTEMSPIFSPYQLRTGDTREVRGLFEYCTKDRKKLYKGPTGDPVVNFTLYELERAIRKEAALVGVDTFLYAPDSEGVMWDMSTNHSRIKYELVKTYVDTCLGPVPEPVYQFDDPTAETEASVLARAMVWDDQAREDSTHLWRLIESHVDPKLLSGLYERLDDYGDRGPGLLLWVALMDEVTSGSPQRMDSVVEHFRNLSLSNYPGENVRLLVNDVLTTYNLLKHSNAVPATVSSMVIAKFLCCSVEEFRTPFYSKSVEIDDEERYLLGKDIMMILAFQNTSLGVKYLCELAMTSYKRLIDYDRWPPIKTVPKKQSDGLPSAYQAFAEELTLLRKNSTKGNLDNKDFSEVTCYQCGKKGHIKPNCPEKPTTRPTDPRKQKKVAEKVDTKRFWKEIPPKVGDPKNMHKDGKTWYWCSKCRGGEGRWTTTHNTATHTGQTTSSPQATAAVANLAHTATTKEEATDNTLVFTPFGYVAACSEENVEWTNFVDALNQEQCMVRQSRTPCVSPQTVQNRYQSQFNINDDTTDDEDFDLFASEADDVLEDYYSKFRLVNALEEDDMMDCDASLLLNRAESPIFMEVDQIGLIRAVLSGQVYYSSSDSSDDESGGDNSDDFDWFLDTF